MDTLLIIIVIGAAVAYCIRTFYLKYQQGKALGKGDVCKSCSGADICDQAHQPDMLNTCSKKENHSH